MNRKLVSRAVLVFVLAGFTAGGGTWNTANAGTRTVEKQVLIPASPERALRAFVDSADLRGWWNVSRSLVQEQPGGVWSVVWDNYGEDRTQHSWVGVVEELSPRRLRIGHLVMIEPGRPLFGPLELEIVAEPAEGGSTLTIYHRGYRSGEDWDWMHDVVDEGWDHVLGDLLQWFVPVPGAQASQPHTDFGT